MGHNGQVSNPHDPALRPLLRGWSHLVSFPIMVVLGTILLIVVNLPFDLLLSLLLYVVGTATMFGVSALYHRVPWRPKAKALMQRFDHSAIFLAIAGGYTPVAVLCLASTKSFTLSPWSLQVCSSQPSPALLPRASLPRTHFLFVKGLLRRGPLS